MSSKPSESSKSSNIITAVIITKDEERNIVRCIGSLGGVADEVIVVDSGSTDATLSLASEAGARCVHHDWEGYSGQKNFAETLASGDWILSIDADEALSDALRKSLMDLKRKGPDAGRVYSVRRLNNFCGSWIRHCGWYPDEKVRLWPRGLCTWSGEVHEELKYTRDAAKVLLDGDLLHYTSYSVEDHISRQIRYALLAARKAYAAGRRCSAAGVVFKPVWTFISSYILRGGFLDGYAGWMVCRVSAFYTFFKYARLRELNHNMDGHDDRI